MEIKYLTILQQNPSFTNKTTGFTVNLAPISNSEITELQNTYNNGNAFPIVLQELLFLAGNLCYVFDIMGTQDIVQQQCRQLLSYNVDVGHTISRPFFGIDQYGGDQFLFIYLDENVDDPILYEALPDTDFDNWLYSIDDTLSGLINKRMIKLLSGYNPF